MRGTGLLRWGELRETLQTAVMRGIFGSNLRLYQQHDGSWQLMESVPVPAGVPELREGVLYPGLIYGLDGLPALVGGVPSDSDPAPGIAVPPAALQLGTGYVRGTRSSELDPWDSPSEFSIVPGLVSGGNATSVDIPVVLLYRGRATRINGYI